METPQHFVIQEFQNKSNIVVHKVNSKQNYILNSINFMVWVCAVKRSVVANIFSQKCSLIKRYSARRCLFRRDKPKIDITITVFCHN